MENYPNFNLIDLITNPYIKMTLFRKMAYSKDLTH